MNILSEPPVNYIILRENRDLQLKQKNSQFIQNRASLVYMLFISLLHIKNMGTFIKYTLISKCTYIFLLCIFCFSVE